MRKNTHTHTHLQPVVTANRKKAGLRGREENLKVKMAEVRKKRKKKRTHHDPRKKNGCRCPDELTSRPNDRDSRLVEEKSYFF